MRLQGWRITAIVFIGVTALSSAVIVTMGLNEAAVRVLVRDTARISVTLFILAFAASSLHTLLRYNWTTWLLKNRRYIGVSFAVSHTAHFLTLVVLYVWFPHPFVEQKLEPVTLIGGGLAYVVLILMTVTSFDRTAALIGPRAWKVLHTVGAYYIWILFAQAYTPRAIANPWYVPLAVLVLLGLGLRMVAWQVRRSRKDDPAFLVECTTVHLKELEISEAREYFFAKVPMVDRFGTSTNKWAECVMNGKHGAYYRTLDGEHIGVYQNSVAEGPARYVFTDMKTDSEEAKQIEAKVFAARTPGFEEKVEVLKNILL